MIQITKNRIEVSFTIGKTKPPAAKKERRYTLAEIRKAEIYRDAFHACRVFDESRRA